jgi:hypothetical protein
MQVLGDGTHVQLAPEQRFHSAVARVAQPEQLPRLTQEQAEVLAIVIADGMAPAGGSRRSEVRRSCRLGQMGSCRCPATARKRWPCCSPEACSRRPGDHANRRPLVYRSTLRLLQLGGVETLEEARLRMRRNSRPPAE